MTGVDSMTNVNEIKPDDIEALARAYIYGTSTQRYVRMYHVSCSFVCNVVNKSDFI